MQAFLTLTIFLCGVALGGGKSGAMLHPLPMGEFFPVPVGILFPPILSSGGINAAALPLTGKATAVQAGHARGTSSDPAGYLGAISATSKNFGINMGYVGSQPAGSSTLTHSGYVGAGFKVDPVAMGIGLRDFDLQNSGGSAVDIGLIAGERKGVTFGFVLYNLNTSAQLTGGVGFGASKKYNMEFNLTLPPFSSSLGSSTTFTASGTIYAGSAVGINFRTSYFSGYETYTHTFGMAVWFSENVSLGIQFSSPRTWVGGLTAVW